MHALLLRQIFTSFSVNKSCLGQVWPERWHVVHRCLSGFEENAWPVEVIPYLLLSMVSDFPHIQSPLHEQPKPNFFKVQARSRLCCLISYPAFSSPHFPHGLFQHANPTSDPLCSQLAWVQSEPGQYLERSTACCLISVEIMEYPEIQHEFWRSCSASPLPDWLTMSLAYVST